jgi:hypothetical protein
MSRSSSQGKITVTADFISDILADVEERNQQVQMQVNAHVSRAKQRAAEAIRQAKEGHIIFPFIYLL